MLQMFEEVYIVSIPDDDHGLVSIKTLEALYVRVAACIILTASCGTGDDVTKMDHHQMCIRMVSHSTMI